MGGLLLSPSRYLRITPKLLIRQNRLSIPRSSARLPKRRKKKGTSKKKQEQKMEEAGVKEEKTDEIGNLSSVGLKVPQRRRLNVGKINAAP